MILLTDDEQAAALRAARYCLAGLKSKRTTDDTSHSRNVLQVELLIQTLERPERTTTNGVWCCKCPKWHQSTTPSCEKCSMEKSA